jgi:hypothetical protein
MDPSMAPMGADSPRENGWLLALAAGVFVVLLSIFPLWSSWTASAFDGGRAAGLGYYSQVLLPLVGLGLIVFAIIEWRAARRRVSTNVPGLRRRHVPMIAAGAWLVATIPVGHLVMRASAAVSRERGDEVVAAIRAYREREGRWPESMDDVRKAATRPLPYPTFQGDWHVTRSGEERLQLEFLATRLWVNRVWVADVETGVWTEYVDGEPQLAR